jgi:hypothetical protein
MLEGRFFFHARKQGVASMEFEVPDGNASEFSMQTANRK